MSQAQVMSGAEAKGYRSSAEWLELEFEVMSCWVC